MRGHQIVAIARFIVLEALHTRLFWLFAAALALIMGAGYFMQQLALTESARLQTVFSAATTRFAAVFVLSLHVLNSGMREVNDKGLELTMSFDLRRSHYILGRLLGFFAIALIIAVVASIPFLLLAPLPAVSQWGLALAFELAMMAAVSLFCIVSFSHLMPAASFVLGFYLLARALSAIQLMSEAPVAGAGTLSHRVISELIDILARVLPALDRYTQSIWLTDGLAPWPELGALAAQTLLYTVLLAAASMFDFYRKNL